MSARVGSMGLALPKGITPAGSGKAGQPKEVVWSILGHRIGSRRNANGCFIFETQDPPGTFVPPHIHPTQDEFIYMLEGTFDLYLDGSWTQARTGDLVRMPKGLLSARWPGKVASPKVWVFRYAAHRSEWRGFSLYPLNRPSCSRHL